MAKKARVNLPDMILGMRVHPAAKCFPAMTQEQFDKLVESIREFGYDENEPIVIHDNMILDGRNRAYAAELVGGTKINVRDWEEGERGSPERFSASVNAHRRDDLSTSQKAMVAAEMADMPEGRPSKTTQVCGVSQEEAASLMGVSVRSVTAAATVRKKDETLAQRVKDGELTVSAAEKIVNGEPTTKKPRKKKDDPAAAPATKKKAPPRPEVLKEWHKNHDEPWSPERAAAAEMEAQETIDIPLAGEQKSLTKRQARALYEYLRTIFEEEG